MQKTMSSRLGLAVVLINSQQLGLSALHGALVRVTTAVMKSHDQRNSRKALSHFILAGNSSSPREVRKKNNQGRYLKTGANAEAMEESCLLPCSA